MPVVTIGGRAGNTFTGVEDTFLEQDAATTNHGSDDFLLARSEVTGELKHTLMKFTGLSNIAGPVTVNSATITINSQGGFAESYLVKVRRLLQNFVHNQATWNVYSTGNSWATAGGLNNGTDRVSSESSSLAIPNPSQDLVFTGAGLAADVQGWINGTFSHYGWMFSSDESNNGHYSTWNSVEASAAAERPVLTVDYTDGLPSTSPVRGRRFYVMP